MNTLSHQLDLLRRRQEAADAAREGAAGAAADKPVPGLEGLRCGVCRILSDDGDGDYTVTERWWNDADGQWDDAVKPLGYVSRAARDFRGRSGGEAGQEVHFWEHQGKAGAVLLVIDVGEESQTGGGGEGLAVSGWVDVDGEGTKTVTLDASDWRSRAVTYAIGWGAEPLTGDEFPNTESGVKVAFTAMTGEVTLVTKTVVNDTVRIYIDGGDDGALKLEITKGTPQSYLHLFYWVQASDYHPDPTT